MKAYNDVLRFPQTTEEVIEHEDDTKEWTQEDQELFIKDLRELVDSWKDSDDPEEVSKFADRATETIMHLLEIYDIKTGN